MPPAHLHEREERLAQIESRDAPGLRNRICGHGSGRCHRRVASGRWCYLHARSHGRAWIRLAPARRLLPLTGWSDRSLPAEDAVVDAFSVFDLDGDGKVTEAELMQTLGKANVGLTEEKIKQLVAEVDVDGDGELELNEFVEYILGK